MNKQSQQDIASRLRTSGLTTRLRASMAATPITAKPKATPPVSGAADSAEAKTYTVMSGQQAVPNVSGHQPVFKQAAAHEAQSMYSQGFMSKCAEYNVDPEQLLKEAGLGSFLMNGLRGAGRFTKNVAGISPKEDVAAARTMLKQWGPLTALAALLPTGLALNAAKEHPADGRLPVGVTPGIALADDGLLTLDIDTPTLTNQTEEPT